MIRMFNINKSTWNNNSRKMFHIRPHVIHMFLCKVVDGFRFVVRDEFTVPETATARLSFACRHVLLQLRSLDHHATQYTLNTNVVQKVRGELIMASNERLFTAEWAGLHLRNAGEAKYATACEAVTRKSAELFANRTL